jgi:hypothetical protein
VLRDPPPAAEVYDDTDAVFILMVMSLVGLLGGLEVVLLAGAAFAVGRAARRAPSRWCGLRRRRPTCAGDRPRRPASVLGLSPGSPGVLLA